MKLIGVGRLGKDPELTVVKDTSVVKFSMAVDYGFGEKKRTEWFNVYMFGKRGENLAKFCKKGEQLYVEAEPVTRSWDKDGQKRYATDYQIVDYRFINQSGKANNVTPSKGKDTDLPDGFVPLDEDELPF